MNKIIQFVVIFLFILSCKPQSFYVDEPNENKIGLIDIDTVYKTITNDSIKIRIGFKDIPKDSIPFKFLRVEIIFDYKNDTSYNGDLGLGYFAFVSDSNGGKPGRRLEINDILKDCSVKALFKYSTRIDNGFYYIIKNMHYNKNYLEINVSKKSHRLFQLITDSLKWHVISQYGDGIERIDYNENYKEKFEDYFSPFYNEKERSK